MGDWTEDHDAALKQYLDDGMSFGEMAPALTARFGIGRSRNACIGRAGRKGWSSKGINGNGMIARKARGKPVAKARQVSTKPAAKLPAPTRVELRELRCIEVAPLHVDFIELRDGQCKYPFGDAVPYTFCGHPAVGCYCAPHAALSTNIDAQSRIRKEPKWFGR